MSEASRIWHSFVEPTLEGVVVIATNVSLEFSLATKKHFPFLSHHKRL